MIIEKGDYVSRISHNNDTIFIVLNIIDDTVYLKGVDVRLYADSPISDLVKVEKTEDREDYTSRVQDKLLLDRSEYFYLPGKVLHFDTEFQLTNTRANPYKIRKKAIFENCKNHQK